MTHLLAMDENGLVDEIYEDIHDVPLIHKAQKLLDKISKTTLLSSLLLLVDLKVLNSILNICMTYILKYAIFFCIKV